MSFSHLGDSRQGHATSSPREIVDETMNERMMIIDWTVEETEYFVS